VRGREDSAKGQVNGAPLKRELQVQERQQSNG